MAHRHSHSVYGVVEREFRLSRPSSSDAPVVVKIGRTSRPAYKRLAQYPNGSTTMFVFDVDAGSEEMVEAAILAAARKRFKPRTEIGAEYFEGPKADILRLACDIAGPFLAVDLPSSPSPEETHGGMDAMPDQGQSVDMDIDDHDSSHQGGRRRGGTKRPRQGEHGIQGRQSRPSGKAMQRPDTTLLVWKYVESHAAALSGQAVPAQQLLDDVTTFVLGRGGTPPTLRGMRCALSAGWGVKLQAGGTRPAFVFPQLTCTL